MREQLKNILPYKYIDELLLIGKEKSIVTSDYLTEFPGMDQRIKQGIIASYLGIQPETLSRIRKKIIF